MWTSGKLKERFVSFFESRNHKTLPGISVVPPNDKTLLFTNSGMVQFKGIFLGDRAEYPRVCTVQRCIRAGGKHNDLDDVGKDNYHHTYFEMLGNWSFGDYFKEDAIRYAYEFLIEDLGLEKDRIYVTIYEDMDHDSRRIWRKYVDDSRIIPSSFKDNFWEMGEFGPCGPCTEIHYDRIGNRDASALVNQDDPDVIEIWNIVFMEYNRTPSGLEELKVKNIDTGIGFERLLSILMGVPSNYQIDSFQSIIRFLEERCSFKFTDGPCIEDVAFRVLSDHARTMAVCLFDKVCFSSDGVGYVLRRILRRAVRYAQDILCLEVGVIAQVVKHAADIMHLDIDVSVIGEEEALFIKTLKNGVIRFNKLVDSKGGLDAHDVFLLYDTYGFPKDLTELMAREKNVSISLDGFEEYKLKAQQLSRCAKSVVTVAFDFEKTDDRFKYSENNLGASLLAIVHNNELIGPDRAEDLKDQFYLVFNRTCFYSEKGGQIGDRGKIVFLDEKEEEPSTIGTFNVADVQCLRGYVLHMGSLEGCVSRRAVLTYDEDARAKTRANHSTCHILYYFLRSFFETSQRGSLVDPEKCRFDFDGNKLSEPVLKELESKMNAFIKTDAKRSVQIVPHEQALLDSTLYLEDGDYSDGVRVISFSSGGVTVRDPCGGTHVACTDEIRLVRIVSETGIQANIRRMVVVSGAKAEEADRNAARLREEVRGGKIVSMDCLLSVFDRNELEMLNKANVRRVQKEVSDRTKAAVRKHKESILSFKLENMLKKRIFVYEEEDVEQFSKKDATKLSATFGNDLFSENVVGFSSVRKDDEMFVSAVSPNNEQLVEELNAEFGPHSFRICKGVVQGIICDQYSASKMKATLSRLLN